MGSMDWYCSLAWHDYDNDIATLTGNVMKGFLEGKKQGWVVFCDTPRNDELKRSF